MNNEVNNNNVNNEVNNTSTTTTTSEVRPENTMGQPQAEQKLDINPQKEAPNPTSIQKEVSNPEPIQKQEPEREFSWSDYETGDKPDSLTVALAKSKIPPKEGQKFIENMNNLQIDAERDKQQEIRQQIVNKFGTEMAGYIEGILESRAGGAKDLLQVPKKLLNEMMDNVPVEERMRYRRKNISTIEELQKEKSQLASEICKSKNSSEKRKLYQRFEEIHNTLIEKNKNR